MFSPRHQTLDQFVVILAHPIVELGVSDHGDGDDEDGGVDQAKDCPSPSTPNYISLYPTPSSLLPHPPSSPKKNKKKIHKILIIWLVAILYYPSRGLSSLTLPTANYVLVRLVS